MAASATVFRSQAVCLREHLAFLGPEAQAAAKRQKKSNGPRQGGPGLPVGYPGQGPRQGGPDEEADLVKGHNSVNKSSVCIIC